MMTTEKVVDDPLQSALEEAEELMQSLDTDASSTVIDGFSIDEAEDVPLTEPEEATKEAISVHPLHDDFLAVAPAPEQPPTPLVPPMNMSSVGPVQQSAPPLTNGTTPPTMMMSSPPPPTMGPPPPTTAMYPSANNANASLDAFRAQTTRFASNFATFAKQAANQVVGTPTAGSNSAPTSFSAPPPPEGQVPMQAIVPVELDNEQKATLVKTHVGELLPGERVIMFLSNLLHVSDSSGFQYSYQAQPSTMWCCAMTYYRIILFGTHPNSLPPRPADWNAACWPCSPPELLQMPLASMDKVEKSVFSSNGGGATNPTTLMGLLIYGKDNGRSLRFTTPSYADTMRAHEALQTYAFPGRRNLGYLYAFESKRSDVMNSVVTDEATGKKTVTLEAVRKRFQGVEEFQRQFARGTGKVQPWAIWSTINASYQTCMSYPSILAGPASLDENNPDAQRTIRQCAAFRSENRLPALTWCSGKDGASLWRASQPKIGLQGNRSSADEMFVKHIMESAASANALAEDQAPLTLSRAMLAQLTGGDVQNWIPEQGCGLKILDLRPRSAAMANRTGGYGYENTSNYPGTTLQFCNIGNIHAVRDSYQKMSALCMSPSTSDMQWNALVEETKWLSHVRLILGAAWEAAFWIHVHRMPVLLHCSHGWDRTSQVAILAQLLLDPYYRTREGFSCLVEKDFMSFGHPFHTRCAHGEGRGEAGASNSGVTTSDEGQISPIFLQLLECVYQLVNLYPECFEFNAKYLLVLSEHVYSCRFGNMLCDTERERELVAGIRQRTHCIWDYLDGRKDTRNPNFSASEGVLLMPLPTLLRNVSLWTDRHAMHGPKPTARWLPSGVERPKDENEGDQQGPLITSQETYALIASATSALTESNSKEEEENEPTVNGSNLSN